MKSFLAIARRLAVLAAWLVILAAVGLLGLEESGVLVDLVRGRLARELGPLGDGLAIERVTLRWFEPGVVIEGVSLSTVPEDGSAGREMLRLRSVHVSLSLGGEGHAPVRRLHVDGGRVRVSDDLIYGFDRIAQSLASSERRSGFLPPRLLFSHVDVVLELPGGAPLGLGRVDLAADPVGEGAFDLRGQLLPSLAGAMPARVAVLIDGHQDEHGLHLHASAQDLLLSTRQVRLPAGVATLPLEDFEGRLDLDGDARLDWSSGSVRVSGEIRAAITEAELALRRDLAAFEDLGIELDARFLPRAGGGLWDRSSWSATAHATADWNTSRCTAWGTFGRAAPEGVLAKTWLRLDGLDIGPGLAASLAPLGPGVADVWTALELRGRVDATIDLTVPSLGPDTPFPPPALALHVASRGEAGATYHGFHDPFRPTRFGIPVPVEEIRGDVVAALDTGGARPWRVGFVDVTAAHPSGTASIEGQVSETDAPSLYVPVDMDLRIRVPSIAIDETLRAALAVNRETAEIWNDFAPEGGTASGDWRLRMSAETNGTTAQGEVTVNATSVAWREVPVRLAPVSGRLRFRWGATPISLTDFGPAGAGARTRPFGVTYDFALDEPGAAGLGVGVRGFARSDYTGLDGISEAEIPAHVFDELEVSIRDLSLRGAAWDVLAARFEEVGRNADALGAKGRVHAAYRGTRSGPDAAYVARVEVVPSVVELSPVAFPLRTRDLAGRVLITSTTAGDGPPVAVTRADVSGSWPGGARVVASGRLGARDDSLSLHAIGFELANQAVRGAIEHVRALDDRGRAGGEDLAIEADTLQGKLDGHVELKPADDGELAPGSVDLFLRENRFAGDEILVDGLVGRLTMNDAGFRAERLGARLGDTPIELREVVLARLGDLASVPEADESLSRSGFWKDPEGLLFQAQLELRDLSLAPEALERWLSPDPESKLGEVESWSGRVDVRGARLVVTRERDGSGRVLLRGPSRFHEFHLRLGLPIEVLNAELDIQELVLEAGRLRGWATVLDLDLDIAARELRDARMIVSYVDGRLTVDRLVGDFEGGRLSSLGGGELGGTGFAVELVPPHAFDLYLRLDDVRVDRLLRGVFHSSIADEGLLTGRLRLQGTPEDVLGLTGSGWLRLDEARLWSIPVVRELFGRLGMDETATFDSLHTRFRLRNGRLRTPYLDVRSSLLHLVGDGTIDLDGGLEYDLEARYSLLDGLGLFSKLVYLLNNSLWRVAVRGDMNRPRVFLRNAFLELLRGFHEPERRALPLPPFAQPPPRF